MSRRKQIFIAPGKEEEELPMEKTPWNIYREAVLPREHWEVIMEFAKDKMPEFGELLEEASTLDDDFSNWNKKKTKKLYEGLKQLSKLINQSQPLTPEVNEEILENHPKEAHIKMLKAVIIVVEISLEINEMFDSYVDS